MTSHDFKVKLTLSPVVTFHHNA